MNKRWSKRSDTRSTRPDSPNGLPTQPRKAFVFTIDVEDWFQVENLKGKIAYDSWDARELRVKESTVRVLEILEAAGIRGTFFILGWTAQRLPSLVRRIAEAGHEIACHGYGHRLLHEMSREEIKEDIQRSLEVLRPLSSHPIIGYRAPSFSITAQAASVLREMGFAYDASYNRFQLNSRYGSAAIPDSLCEFPVTVNTYAGINWPLGGGYFRLSPMWFLKKQLQDAFDPAATRIHSLYLHPWELDPGQPRVKGLKKNYAFRHYYGLEKNAEKLREFIGLVKGQKTVAVRRFMDLI